MDLSTPMIDNNEIEYLDKLTESDLPDLNSNIFVQLYNEDKLGGMIRNLEIWLKAIFTQVKGYKFDT